MFSRVDRLWRLFGTGAAFSLFGLGALGMVVFIFPLFFLLIPNQKRRHHRAQWVICRSFRLFLTILRRLGVADVTTDGIEALRSASGVLIIANHPTLLDVVLILAQMDRCQCVVKSQLFRNPFTAGVMRAAGFIRNDGDPERLMDQARRHLQNGDCIMIFPEGTRTPRNQRLGALQRGAANIAIDAAVDLLPIVIGCNHQTLKKGEPWYKVPITKTKFYLSTKKLIVTQNFVDRDTPRSKQSRSLNLEIETFFLETLANDPSRF